MMIRTWPRHQLILHEERNESSRSRLLMKDHRLLLDQQKEKVEKATSEKERIRSIPPVHLFPLLEQYI